MRCFKIKYRKTLLVGIVILFTFFGTIPSGKTPSGSQVIGAGLYWSIEYNLSPDIVSISGTYTANDTLDVFVTDNLTHKMDYINSGVLPKNALWNDSPSLNGNFVVAITNTSAKHWVMFGNINGTGDVSLTYDVSVQAQGIAGFEFLIVYITLIAIISIYLYRRNEAVPSLKFGKR